MDHTIYKKYHIKCFTTPQRVVQIFIQMKIKLSFLIIALTAAINLTAQIDEVKLEVIDSLFSEWNTPNHPGGAVGIMQDGKIAYSKAFGLASLEYLVPNTKGTRFNIASISKQFTGMAIVKLHLDGKLSIDEDIRTYLPEIPDLGYKITCRQMLHHTSGLRSLHSMLSLAGWRSDDARDNKDLLRFMKKQKNLNFEPGSEYMYCNTGYILMALIIERLSGEKFAEWMHREIFTPLGMNDSYVEDRYNRIVTNNATSYKGSSEKGFVRSVEYWGYTGSGNIHATTDDILKWFRYYYKAPEGWKEAFEMMLTTDTFNDGSHNKYAFGVNVDTFLGENRITHSGSIGGFRANALTFPERQTEIVILTNFSSSGTGDKTNSIVSILFDKTLPESKGPEQEKDTIKYQVSEKELMEISGNYWSPELETMYKFYVNKGRLIGFHNRHGEFFVKPVEKDIYKPEKGPIEKIEIIKDKKEKIMGMKVTNSRVRNLWMEKVK